MKVFIGMKVPRADEELRLAADLLPASVKSTGHQPFLATDEIASRGLTNPKDFMPFVWEHLRSADLVIILNHPDLRGGLIEAGMAYAWDIPIWLCHKPGERVSSSMRGCTDVTIEYETLDDLRDKLSSQLKGLTQ
jgi:nucleoside 2-deoxyribosyltransferase